MSPFVTPYPPIMRARIRLVPCWRCSRKHPRLAQSAQLAQFLPLGFASAVVLGRAARRWPPCDEKERPQSDRRRSGASYRYAETNVAASSPQTSQTSAAARRRPRDPHSTQAHLCCMRSTQRSSTASGSAITKSSSSVTRSGSRRRSAESSREGMRPPEDVRLPMSRDSRSPNHRGRFSNRSVEVVRKVPRPTTPSRPNPSTDRDCGFGLGGQNATGAAHPPL